MSKNRKRVNELAVHVAHASIIATVILGLGFGFTESPFLGVSAIVAGLVAMGSASSIVIRVPSGSGVSNEIPAASGVY
jgi:hypothetical protein